MRPAAIERPTVQLGVQPSVGALQIQPQVSLQFEEERAKQIELQKSIQEPKQIELQKSIERTKQIELQKSLQLQKQLQAQKQLQRLSLESSQLFRQPTIPKPPRPPPPLPPLPLPTPTPAEKAIKELAKAVKGDFEVFARIEGQDISIGKAKTLKKAAKKLSKKLKGTLAASGFLEEGGRRLSAIETGLIDNEFRVGRLDVTRVVQKKERRLGTPTETEQIQFFRKSKGGGNLFGSSNRGRKNPNFF